MGLPAEICAALFRLRDYRAPACGRKSVDLNQLLFRHQIALMRLADAAGNPRRDLLIDDVRTSRQKIEAKRRFLGVSQYPAWIRLFGDIAP